MWERDAKALAALRRNSQELGLSGVEVASADATTALKTQGELFDVIFLDPPFSADLLEDALAGAATRLRPGGRIYAESPQPLPAELLERLGLSAIRQGKAGHSHYCLLERI